MTVPAIRRPIQPAVFLARANYFALGITRVNVDGTISPIVWSNYNKVVVSVLASTPVQRDSVAHPTLFDITTNGRLVLKLGSIGVPDGDYYIRVTAVKASGEKDEIIHEEADFTKVYVSFKATSTVA